MATIEQRIKTLEARLPVIPQRVSRFIWDERLSTPEELVRIQSQIDEADERGDLVIIRDIIDPPSVS